MSGKKELQEYAELRDLLARKAPLLAGEGLKPRDLVEAFWKQNRKAVERALDELVTIGLLRTLATTNKRRMRGRKSGQLDMWAMWSLPQMVSVTAEDGQARQKPTHRLTLSEGKAWVAEHHRERERNLQDAIKLEKLIETVEPFMQDDPKMTLDEGLAAARKAGAVEAIPS